MVGGVVVVCVHVCVCMCVCACACVHVCVCVCVCVCLGVYNICVPVDVCLYTTTHNTTLSPQNVTDLRVALVDIICYMGLIGILK